MRSAVLVALAMCCSLAQPVVNFGSNVVCPRSRSFPVCYESAPAPRLLAVSHAVSGEPVARVHLMERCVHVATSLLRAGQSYEIDGALFHVAAAPGGQWLGHSTSPVGQLRTEFALQSNAAVREAWLYASGIGYSEYELNGRKVFDDDRTLDPAWTDYTQRVMFVAENVTRLLQRVNCLGVWLGNGWFSQDQWIAPAKQEPSFVGPRVSLTLSISFVDGQTQQIDSHTSLFTARLGPILQDSVYHGEQFDTRVHVANWSSVGGGAEFAVRPEAMSPPGGALFLQTQPPVRILRCFQPVRVIDALLNLQIFDFGVNAAGVLRINATGPRGTTVIARHAEFLDWNAPAPFVGVYNLRAAAATDRFILSGGNDSFLPRFTVHGFRYAELRNLPTTYTVEMCLLSSAPEKWANFQSSSLTIDATYAATGNAIRSNWLSVISDTCARDERKQWQGDAALTVFPALHMFENLEPMYIQMLRVVRDAQLRNGKGIVLGDTAPLSFGSAIGDPAWGMAYPQTLFALATYAGASSRADIEEHFPHAMAWIRFLQEQVTAVGIGKLYYNYGDWVPPPPAEKVSGHMTSAFAFIKQLQSMQTVATFLNMTQEAATLESQVVAAQEQFHKAFFISSCNCYHKTEQAGDVFALASGSVPSSVLPQVKQHLLSLIANDGNHFSTGIVSMSQLFFVLHDIVQRPDVALDILNTVDYPSYGFTFNNPYDNATNLHEIWDFFKQGGGMNSYSHHMYGSVAHYFVTRLAGIQPQANGELVVQIPHLSGKQLSWVRSSHRGHSVEWRIQDGLLSGEVHVASRATLRLPGRPDRVVESGTHRFHGIAAATDPGPLRANPGNRFARYYSGIE